ncbi:hypothetical protein D9M68_20070 [compost metagenome]
MIVINTSQAIAELLPEVYFAFDPDVPFMEMDLSKMMRKHMRDMIMHAFYHALNNDQFYENEWLVMLRRDRFLDSFSDKRWIDIEVIDTEGTYILIFEEH